MKRSELREAIFKLLFMSQFNSLEEMPEQIRLYFQTMENEEDAELVRKPSEADETYIREKYEKIQEHLPELDQRLSAVSSGWKLSRMAKVDLTILRLAAYEMLLDEEIPVGVAINEAVEIAKRFGGEESASFINGVLGKLAREEEQP